MVESTPRSKFSCMKDFQDHAFQILPTNVKNYYSYGEEDTMKWNREAFKKLAIFDEYLKEKKDPLKTWTVQHSVDLQDDSLTWEDIDWLKSKTKLPIVVKGILSAEDALLAAKHGASAIYVSNHGGRQIDGVLATIEALPAIVKAVGAIAEVYVDGGVTKGTDVFKALALGAKMVFVGRTMLWGLACGGEAGSRAVLETYRNEIECAFAITGCSRVNQVTRNLIAHESTLYV